jgi:hypothetical protein
VCCFATGIPRGSRAPLAFPRRCPVRDGGRPSDSLTQPVDRSRDMDWPEHILHRTTCASNSGSSPGAQGCGGCSMDERWLQSAPLTREPPRRLEHSRRRAECHKANESSASNGLAARCCQQTVETHGLVDWRLEELQACDGERFKRAQRAACDPSEAPTERDGLSEPRRRPV